jgi:hypothetical protein
LTVDKAAAHRFVKSSLAGNPDQKRKVQSSDDGEEEESEEDSKPKDKKHAGDNNTQGANKRRRGIDPFTGMCIGPFQYQQLSH